MNIHEYQASEILRAFGIPTPRGEVAETPEQAGEIAARLGGAVVVKAQVHAGGRGKAGGVKLVKSPAEAVEAARSMLGRNLVTHQTGPDGVPVRKVLVAEATDIKQELYLSVVIDGDLGVPVVIASTEGGVEIEEVAAHSPEKLIRVPADALIGLSPYRARDVAAALNVPPETQRAVAALVSNLYRVFIENDCSLVEINPLVITASNEVIALDAKINLEDEALFRRPDLAALKDPEQMGDLERRADEAGLAYVKLEGGRVGCMVNGAGLAMATMDITKWAGAAPANFLDIGGSADQSRIEEAFRIIISDSDVEIILINLFAGIARADVVARGIVNAARESGTSLPMVVAMRGTNAEEGRAILDEAGLRITSVPDLGGAAETLREMLAGARGKN